MYSSIVPILVWLLILGVVAFAWIKGGRPERLGGIFVVIAGVAAFVVHAIVPVEWQPVCLLADEALLAMAFLLLALRYASVWLGGAMILQAVQFSLHAYYFVADRPHDRFYSTVNNIDTIGVLACILFGTLLAWRKRARAAK